MLPAYKTFGELNYSAKLSEHQVRDIRRRLKQGTPGVKLAREYRVHPMTITRIKLRRSWSYLED